MGAFSNGVCGVFAWSIKTIGACCCCGRAPKNPEVPEPHPKEDEKSNALLSLDSMLDAFFVVFDLPIRAIECCWSIMSCGGGRKPANVQYVPRVRSQREIDRH